MNQIIGLTRARTRRRYYGTNKTETDDTT